MSQGQSIKPQPDKDSEQEAIKYGDVFDVTGGLASKPIAPRDAATMLAAETQVLGKPLDTGAAAIMYSAAAANVTAGVVGPDEGNEMVEREGVAVSKSRDAQGKLVVNEAIADRMVCENHYNPYDVRGITLSASPSPTIREEQWTIPSSSTLIPTPMAVGGVDQSGITIGEALEETVLSIGDKPVDQGDAAAIRVAEARAAASRLTQHSGLGIRAQAAATFNDRLANDYNKITISDVLADAVEKLPLSKAVTNEDADGVRAAEQRNKPDMVVTPGGVGDTMATAARVNRDHTPS